MRIVVVQKIRNSVTFRHNSTFKVVIVRTHKFQKLHLGLNQNLCSCKRVFFLKNVSFVPCVTILTSDNTKFPKSAIDFDTIRDSHSFFSATMVLTSSISSGTKKKYKFRGWFDYKPACFHPSFQILIKQNFQGT